jgi:hypothetical protein
VQAAAGHPRHREVAGDGDLLCLGGPAREPERGRDESLVHLTPLDERGILGVVGDHDLDGERLRVHERVPQYPRRRNGVPVVAEDPDARVHHLAHLGERLPRQTLRDRADGEDLAQTGRARQLADLAHDRGVVGHRLGVRHRRDRRISPDRRRSATRLDRLLVFEAGLPEMRVEVDEAGHDERAVAVDHLGTGETGPPTHRRHASVVDPDVGDLVPAGARVDDAATAQHEGRRRVGLRARGHSAASEPVPPRSR